MIAALWDWLGGIEWARLFPEIVGKFLGFLFGFTASRLLFFRRRLKALDRLKQGDSDDVLFKAHFLSDRNEEGLPMVDEQTVHWRVRYLSAGIFDREVPVGPPVAVPWKKQEVELHHLGLRLSVDSDDA